MYGDRALVLQMVVNLIENAVHHRSDDEMLIRLDAGQHEGRVWFSVADNGVGIPEQQAVLVLV